MSGRKKAKMACAKDRISQLPDHLICQILSHIPAKDAVNTSVLSIRWKSLWLWVPSLELDSGIFLDFNAFVSFGYRFFESNRVSCIQKLELTIEVSRTDDASYFTSWIDAVVKRKIQHLYVRCIVYDYLYEIPPSLYICETLVSLELRWGKWPSIEFISLPRLKTMNLFNNSFPNEASFEKLVSCCPVLEELHILSNMKHTKVFRVHSRSLKRFTFRRTSPFPEVFIDAPLLCGLKIVNSISYFVLRNNLESIAKLDISIGNGYWSFNDNANDSLRRSHIRSFLSRISRVRDMTICKEAFKVIHHYSQFEQLPQFGYMSHLYVSLYAHDLKLLTTFLENCPNLKSLVLFLYDSEEMNQFNFSLVPKCFLSSLEFVDFKVRIQGYAAELKLVKYFLEHSAILKKLTLRLEFSSRKYDVFKELLRIPRGSTKCVLVVKEW